MSLEIVKFVNCIIFGLIEIYLIYEMRGNKEKVELSSKRWLAIIVITVILVLMANYVVPLYLKLVTIVIQSIIICQLMYKISFIKKMFISVAVLSIVWLTDTLASSLFIVILKINMMNVLSNLYYYTFYNLLNIILIIFTIILFKTRRFVLSINDNISKRAKYLLLAIILLQFLSIFIEFFMTYYIMNIPNLHFISIISYICSIFSIGILLYSANVIIDKENIIKISNEYNEKLSVYNEVLQNSMENQRKIAHEHGNQLAVLSGYIANANLEKASKYLEKIIGIHNAENEYLCSIKESGLKALLVFKTAMIERKNIELEMVIDEDICDTIIPSEDLCKIMGVFLDNATEAASQSEEPYICLTILKNEDSLVISIMNSIKDIEIDTKKIFKKGYSSKGEGRGYGLYIVEDIVKKYEELELHTRVEDELFIQELQVTCKTISLTKN